MRVTSAFTTVSGEGRKSQSNYFKMTSTCIYILVWSYMAILCLRKVGEGAVDEGTVGGGTVGEGAVDENTVGRGTVGEGAVDENNVGRGTVGEGTVGEGIVGEGTVGWGTVGESTVGEALWMRTLWYGHCG